MWRVTVTGRTTLRRQPDVQATPKPAWPRWWRSVSDTSCVCLHHLNHSFPSLDRVREEGSRYRWCNITHVRMRETIGVTVRTMMWRGRRILCLWIKGDFLPICYLGAAVSLDRTVQSSGPVSSFRETPCSVLGRVSCTAIASRPEWENVARCQRGYTQ